MGCACSLCVHPWGLEKSGGMWSASFDTLTVSICALSSSELQDTVQGKLGCFLHSHWEASFYHRVTPEKVQRTMSRIFPASLRRIRRASGQRGQKKMRLTNCHASGHKLRSERLGFLLCCSFGRYCE